MQSNAHRSSIGSREIIRKIVASRKPIIKKLRWNY